MSFVGLQDNLRKELRKRIDAGELTGMELARRTGFTQAHISNFLNRKRGLKLSALDRMVKAIGLTLYDLLNPHEVAKVAAVSRSAGPGKDEEYEVAPLVEGSIAAGSEVIVNEEVKELLKFRKSFLQRLRADLAAVPRSQQGKEGGRKSWTRFVLIKVDQKEGMSMWPRVGPGATLLIDRHYNSLTAYHKGERNLYAVRKGDGCTVKYVELRETAPGAPGGMLVLRPHNPDYPVEVVPIEEGQTYADLIIGRVAHVSAEM
ncbi:MAG: LexA family transcriptional regulator [Acidobacteria bacterium]|nr:LexA family transcriptional regulator [Acidobacteriota bacterium]MCL5287019.1 LexA family transcriptional regulator [Acidobacteriota bacterium]